MMNYIKLLIIDYYKVTIRRAKELWLFPTSLLVYILFFHFFLPDYPNCMIKLFFGMPCAGCGLTRSTLALMRFDFVQSFRYHPITLLVYFYCFVIAYKERKTWNFLYRSKFFWIIGVILFIGTFILRMIYVFPNVPLDPHENPIIINLF